MAETTAACEYPSHPHQAGVVETVSVTAGGMILVVDGTVSFTGGFCIADAWLGDTPAA